MKTIENFIALEQQYDIIVAFKINGNE